MKKKDISYMDEVYTGNDSTAPDVVAKTSHTKATTAHPHASLQCDLKEHHAQFNAIRGTNVSKDESASNIHCPGFLVPPRGSNTWGVK
jgi:hypothetical protein